MHGSIVDVTGNGVGSIPFPRLSKVFLFVPDIVLRCGDDSRLLDAFDDPTCRSALQYGVGSKSFPVPAARRKSTQRSHRWPKKNVDSL